MVASKLLKSGPRFDALLCLQMKAGRFLGLSNAGYPLSVTGDVGLHDDSSME